MKLDSKVMKIGKDVYTIQEIIMKHMLPILPGLAEEATQAKAQLDIMKHSVILNGEPLGERVLDLGLKTYMKLMPLVLEVNGVKVSDEGKD